MADQQDPGPHTGGASFRSRASSVISTNTKFSISTLPQESNHIDGILNSQSAQLDNIWNSHAGRLAATRPASMYSFRSLPPYDEDYPTGSGLPDLNESANSARSTGPHVQFAAAQETSEAAESLDQSPPSPTDPDNALSMHYGRIVRTIDENHARQLARINEDRARQLEAHEQNLSAMRHEIDQAYRQELKAKNKEVERIREEAGSSIAALESEIKALKLTHDKAIEALKLIHDNDMARAHQEVEQTISKFEREYAAAIEKARHAVEDTWESRWHDRNKLDAAEAIRRDQETQEKLSRAAAESDEKWISVLKLKCPERLDELQSFKGTLKPPPTA